MSIKYIRINNIDKESTNLKNRLSQCTQLIISAPTKEFRAFNPSGKICPYSNEFTQPTGLL